MNGQRTRRKRPGSDRGQRRWRAAAFVAPYGRKPAGRSELPRPAAPVTGRVRYPPYRPMPRPAARTRPSGTRELRDRRKGHQHEDGTPRIVRAAPSTRKGTRRSFLAAPQKGSSGPTLARGASSDPAGLTARARPEARPRGARRTSARKPGTYRKGEPEQSAPKRRNRARTRGLTAMAVYCADIYSQLLAVYRERERRTRNRNFADKPPM